MGNLKELSLNELKRKQQLTLDEKIEYSKGVIKEFVEAVGGYDKTYISFSGGKDSTVLLHLVRQIYPDTKAVFCNTGLEYPEIVEFVKGFDNVEWLKPRKTFSQVWKEFGLPSVSKEQSGYIREVRLGTSDNMVNKRLNHRGSYSIYKKWVFLTDKDFTKYDSSNYCCKYFKKLPTEDYEKETGRFPFVGTMAGESLLRLNSWVKYSCNMFDGNKIQSRPLSIWTDDDIWEYIKRFNLDYCILYDKGHERTGCSVCAYGSQLDKSEKNKFELLKEQHPNHYKALRKLGLRDVLMDMGVRISNDEEYMKDMENRQREIKEWYKFVENDLYDNGKDSKYFKYYKYFEKKLVKRIEKEKQK